MCYHEEGGLRGRHVILQVFYDFNVQVVGGLVQYHERGFLDEHTGQGHFLDLSARQGPHFPVHCTKLKVCQDAFYLLVVIPAVQPVHVVDGLFQAFLVFRFQSLFVGSQRLHDLLIGRAHLLQDR